MAWGSTRAARARGQTDAGNRRGTYALPRTQAEPGFDLLAQISVRGIGAANHSQPQRKLAACGTVLSRRQLREILLTKLPCRALVVLCQPFLGLA